MNVHRFALPPKVQRAAEPLVEIAQLQVIDPQPLRLSSTWSYTIRQSLRSRTTIRRTWPGKASPSDLRKQVEKKHPICVLFRAKPQCWLCDICIYFIWFAGFVCVFMYLLSLWIHVIAALDQSSFGFFWERELLLQVSYRLSKHFAAWFCEMASRWNLCHKCQKIGHHFLRNVFVVTHTTHKSQLHLCVQPVTPNDPPFGILALSDHHTE